MNYSDIDKALSDPGFFVDNDPHPLWHQLRQEDPVHWTRDSLGDCDHALRRHHRSNKRARALHLGATDLSADHTRGRTDNP